MNNPSTRIFRGVTLLWFVVFLLGQLIFAGYIILLYGRSAVLGNYDKWNTTVPRMYIPGHFMHNALFGVHVAAAALISMAGPLQLIPQLRAYAPRYHRIAGRRDR